MKWVMVQRNAKAYEIDVPMSINYRRSNPRADMKRRDKMSYRKKKTKEWRERRKRRRANDAKKCRDPLYSDCLFSEWQQGMTSSNIIFR